MKVRLTLGKNLQSTATPQVSLIKKGNSAMLRIEIELLKNVANPKDDGDYTSPTDEPFYRDAALGELVSFDLETVKVDHINTNQSSSKLTVVGTLGTKVPHTPMG